MKKVLVFTGEQETLYILINERGASEGTIYSRSNSAKDLEIAVSNLALRGWDLETADFKKLEEVHYDPGPQ